MTGRCKVEACLYIRSKNSRLCWCVKQRRCQGRLGLCVFDCLIQTSTLRLSAASASVTFTGASSFAHSPMCEKNINGPTT